MIIYLSLLVCLLGGAFYALATNPKVVQLGLVAFGCGLLAFLMRVATLPHVIGG